MKNKLMIDVDTDRHETPVMISKPEGFDIEEATSDKDKLKKMILDDMTTICNGLGILIQVGEDNNYFSGEETAKMCVKYLEDNFINRVKTNEVE
tara:strand:- start:710 stop:991 length:282 start_codon:yes stop_codon:yes gene_type:complete